MKFVKMLLQCSGHRTGAACLGCALPPPPPPEKYIFGTPCPIQEVLQSPNLFAPPPPPKNTSIDCYMLNNLYGIKV